MIFLLSKYSPCHGLILLVNIFRLDQFHTWTYLTVTYTHLVFHLIDEIIYTRQLYAILKKKQQMNNK